MSTDPKPLEALRQEIREAVAAGRLDSALELAGQALALAQAGEDQAEVDRLCLTRGAIQVARGEGAEAVQEMRRILMRSSDRGNRFNAAYAISQHHERIGDIERGRFYANTALSYAEAWDDPAAIAKAHNQIANLELLGSYFEEAAASYEKALALLENEVTIESAILLSNLGYCHTVIGRYDRAFRELTRSADMLGYLEASRWQHLPLLGLAYAYLEIERFELAVEHARRALELAEAALYQDNQVKNALYLLGEASKLAGEEEEAYEHFTHLQQRFYPDQPLIVDVLLATDIRKLINLMA